MSTISELSTEEVNFGTVGHLIDAEVLVRFTIEGEPMTKSRPRFARQGGKVIAYTPANVKQGEARIAAAYLSAPGRRRAVADSQRTFGVIAIFFTDSAQRRDVDNMLKLILDGLTKIAWADDCQVTEVTGRKVQCSPESTPRTEVLIYHVGAVPVAVGICQLCGAEFPKPKSHTKKMFCSQACRSESLRARRLKKCKQCGKEYAHHSGHAEQSYCSMACKAAATHADVTCANCAKPFTKPRSLVRYGNSYCSAECKAGYWAAQRKSAAKGTCQDCGGPTTKKTYKRCRDCNYAAGGAWAS